MPKVTQRRETPRRCRRRRRHGGPDRHGRTNWGGTACLAERFHL